MILTLMGRKELPSELLNFIREEIEIFSNLRNEELKKEKPNKDVAEALSRKINSLEGLLE